MLRPRGCGSSARARRRVEQLLASCRVRPGADQPVAVELAVGAVVGGGHPALHRHHRATLRAGDTWQGDRRLGVARPRRRPVNARRPVTGDGGRRHRPPELAHPTQDQLAVGLLVEEEETLVQQVVRASSPPTGRACASRVRTAAAPRQLRQGHLLERKEHVGRRGVHPRRRTANANARPASARSRWAALSIGAHGTVVAPWRSRGKRRRRRRPRRCRAGGGARRVVVGAGSAGAWWRPTWPPAGARCCSRPDPTPVPRRCRPAVPGPNFLAAARPTGRWPDADGASHPAAGTRAATCGAGAWAAVLGGERHGRRCGVRPLTTTGGADAHRWAADGGAGQDRTSPPVVEAPASRRGPRSSGLRHGGARRRPPVVRGLSPLRRRRPRRRSGGPHRRPLGRRVSTNDGYLEGQRARPYLTVRGDAGGGTDAARRRTGGRDPSCRRWRGPR